MSADLLPPNVPLVEQISEVEREIALRERVYPKWVTRGIMRQTEAAIHIERMRAVLATLRRLEGLRNERASKANPIAR